jgi:hypothetical protein
VTIELKPAQSVLLSGHIGGVTRPVHDGVTYPGSSMSRMLRNGAAYSSVCARVPLKNSVSHRH